MLTRNLVLKLVVAGAVVVASVAPRSASAQANGQLVSSLTRLHAAQLSFVKRLSEDPAFARQWESATASGNYDAAEGLAASAAGMDKRYTHVGPRGASMTGISNPGAQSPVMIRYASVVKSETTATSMGAGFVCFNLGIISGCITFN
jgi:hypothetical protein